MRWGGEEVGWVPRRGGRGMAGVHFAHCVWRLHTGGRAKWGSFVEKEKMSLAGTALYALPAHGNPRSGNSFLRFRTSIHPSGQNIRSCFIP